MVGPRKRARYQRTRRERCRERSTAVREHAPKALRRSRASLRMRRYSGEWSSRSTIRSRCTLACSARRTTGERQHLSACMGQRRPGSKAPTRPFRTAQRSRHLLVSRSPPVQRSVEMPPLPAITSTPTRMRSVIGSDSRRPRRTSTSRPTKQLTRSSSGRVSSSPAGSGARAMPTRPWPITRLTSPSPATRLPTCSATWARCSSRHRRPCSANAGQTLPMAEDGAPLSLPSIVPIRWRVRATTAARCALSSPWA